MTILTMKDGILAADCAASAGNKSFKSPTLKIYANDQIVIAFAGEFATSYKACVHRLAFPDLLDDEFDGNRTVLFIKRAKNNIVWQTENGGFPVPTFLSSNEYIAVGSGAQFAEGAMEMGASAEDAARVAGRLDVYCDTNIVQFDVNAWEYAKKLRQEPKRQLRSALKLADRLRAAAEH